MELDVVSEHEATLLLQSDSWMGEQELMRVDSLGQEIFPQGNQASSIEELLGRRRELKEGVRMALEHKRVEVKQAIDGGSGLALRLGTGAVYKLVPTLREVLPNFVGLLFAGLTATNYFVLYSLWVGLSSIQIIKQLLSGFERLEDEVERAVFEGIYVIQGRVSVRDYDALAAQEFERAYATIAPTGMDLARHFAELFSSEQIEGALQSLKSREILSEDNGRWTIKI